METDDFLEHYGVKGMKWGVRQDNGHAGERVKLRKLPKLDKKYERSFQGLNGFIKVNNAFASHVNPQLDAINAKPKYANQSFSKASLQNPETKKLHEDYQTEIIGAAHAAAASVSTSFGTNASGTKRLEVFIAGEGEDMAWNMRMVDATKVQHADAPTDGGIPDDYDVIVKPLFDADGKVVDLAIFPGKTLKQSALDAEIDAFLEHYGVKGMKWGVHRNTAPAAVSTNQRPGKRVKARGGTNQPAHPDAVRTATQKRIARKSSVDALSDRELQQVVKRMQLEQQYGQLNPSVKQSGVKFVRDLLLGVGKSQSSRIANDIASQAVSDAMAAHGPESLKKK